MLKNLKKTAHILNVVWRSSKAYLIVCLLLSVFQAVFPFINIIGSYLILDALIAYAETETILTIVFYMIGLNLIVGISLKVLTYFGNVLSVKLSYRISNLIALKNFELDYEQIESNKVMDMIQKAEDGSNSSGDITSYCGYSLTNVVTNGLMIIYAVIILVGLFTRVETAETGIIVSILNNGFSCLFVIVPLISVCITVLLLSSKINKIAYKAMLGNIDGNRRFGYLYDVCSNYQLGKELRIYRMQKMIQSIMLDKKYSINSVWRSYGISLSKIQAVTIAVNHVLTFIAYVYVGLKAMYGLISIGNVVQYVASITLLSSSLEKVVTGYIQMCLSNEYLDNYFDFLNLKTNIRFGKRELDLTDSLAIDFVDISFTYPNQEKEAVSNVNLHIEKGEKLAIVGLNGAGKTTLIKLLCRLYAPTSGSILINGVNIEEYSKDSCYKLFSVVFQDFKLFSYSIKDNVCSGRDGDEEKAVECLKQAGLEERIAKLDKGIDTLIYQRNVEAGIEISGGEAQKIAIARALYKDSPIVILDEPTSALDPKSEAEIYEKFNALVYHKTAIFISHRMSSCKFCDRIIVFDGGKIVQSGPHNNLLNDENGLYYKMWHAQSKYYED